MDTARVLGVSHGSIYRHFPDRDALREAVIERRLTRLRDTLPAGQDHHPAAWLDALYATHRDAARTDPELHAVYAHLPAYSTVVSRHHQALATTLTRLLETGPAPSWAHDHLHAATTALTALTAFLDPRLSPAAGSRALHRRARPRHNRPDRQLTRPPGQEREIRACPGQQPAAP
ncbi:TetR/AcrR family transcriptional regulator [Streptomyces sp. NPDC088747]|uniref:TetR/AcrR family transcriptional regulator n=1 Tax=Streptomyces sp. NPDC088747 TaxID=3365886 RepID=UPI00381CF57F